MSSDLNAKDLLPLSFLWYVIPKVQQEYQWMSSSRVRMRSIRVWMIQYLADLLERLTANDKVETVLGFGQHPAKKWNLSGGR